MAYTSLMDMFDGGGMGRSGDTFQGGGILSQIANMVASPIGSQDNILKRKNETGRAIGNAVKILNNSGNNFKPLRRERFRDIAQVTELGNVSFDEFKELATQEFAAMGIQPTFQQMMDAYLNYLNRP